MRQACYQSADSLVTSIHPANIICNAFFGGSRTSTIRYNEAGPVFNSLPFVPSSNPSIQCNPSSSRFCRSWPPRWPFARSRISLSMTLTHGLYTALLAGIPRTLAALPTSLTSTDIWAP